MGDQPAAIDKLSDGILAGLEDQILLGVTGSGKTFTIANVIEKVQKPTLVLAHNKTLAAQLYQEFREFFPENAVSYFVSYYDFYQPEAYIPRTDTYIEKETDINQEIDKLRLQATANLLTRKDVIVVSSVSCIYGLGDPVEWQKHTLIIEKNKDLERKKLLGKLTDLQYERSEFDFRRGTFRVAGENIDIYPSYDDFGIRISTDCLRISRIQKIDALTGKILEELDSFVLYPAKHYMTDPEKYKEVFEKIRMDADEQVKKFKDAGKLIEAQRIGQRVNYDLEMIQEVGYVNGIENYSRYFEGRKEGEPPYTLLDYFDKDFLMVIDESHMTIPQVRGMYNGDQSRKQTLIDYGFRLPASRDNRPLRFGEFLRRKGQAIYVSATPSQWEKDRSSEIVEQLIRPTGICDPMVEVRPTTGQVEDLIKEIGVQVENKRRVLVTTMTKRMAEELTEYLKEKDNLKVAYLHSDVETFERSKLLKQLRLGEFDVLVGINLLREGLDLPEVGLVAILDADKEGFLRSDVSLIQTMGRAARNIDAKVILYGDLMTGSMERAINEVRRRREVQIKWNEDHDITPTNIIKAIRDDIFINEANETNKTNEARDIEELTPQDKAKYKKILEKRMKEAARILDFEGAAMYRDKIKSLGSVRD